MWAWITDVEKLQKERGHADAETPTTTSKEKFSKMLQNALFNTGEDRRAMRQLNCACAPQVNAAHSETQLEVLLIIPNGQEEDPHSKVVTLFLSYSVSLTSVLMKEQGGFLL